jgi:hypothetical protein
MVVDRNIDAAAEERTRRLLVRLADDWTEIARS